MEPGIGQGRTGSKGKKAPINQSIAQSAENSKSVTKIPADVINMLNFATHVQSISSSNREAINRRTMQQISKDIPLYSDPVYRPPLSQ